jgi:hypothetical protein
MNAAIVREWLDHVEADLDAAWSCNRGPRAPPLPSRDRLDTWVAEIEALKADFERWLGQGASGAKGA